MATPNAEALSRICGDAGALRAVHYVLFDDSPSLLVGVIFDFETLNATMLAESTYDEILIRLAPYDLESDEKLLTVSGRSPWNELCGLRIRWAWEMTNQQGYNDGLRFEFGDPETGEKGETVEMLVAASAIQVSLARSVTI